MDYSKKKTVEDIDVAGKKVLVRCDFNVPLDENGNITDTKRIDEAMKTINYLVSHNAKVILCSHLGRPKGEVNMKYSLKPVAAYLSKKLGFDVKMASDVVGDSAKAIAADLKDGEVELLENVRFEKGETKNDPELAKAMASLAEIYVNDAFGTAHRAHASTAGVADYLPAVCGYLIQKEISVMGTALSNPEAPLRRYPGRRQGFRQDRRYQQPAGKGRYPDHRRRHGLHLYERSGLFHRHLHLRGGQG